MIRLSPAKKMMDRADADKLPADHPLRLRAAELVKAQTNYDSPRVYMNVWNRAFRAWHAYTGEDFS